eukprot:m.42531 g.42531  ORF g.42531 m.42531 type:complete len:266 (-) comp14346_c0_seq2:21-818(-)
MLRSTVALRLARTLVSWARASENVAHFKLNNPPVNAISKQLITEAKQAWSDMEASGVQGAVITTDNKKVFCAGINLPEIIDTTEAQFCEYYGLFEGFMRQVLMSPLATVAAIPGFAPAGGTVLALCCDYRISVPSDKPTIGLTEVAVGIAAPSWIMEMAKLNLGFRNAEYDLCLGRAMPPQEALERGYLHEIVPAEDLLPRAHTVLEAYLAAPAHARQKSKLELRQPIANLMGPDSIARFYKTCSDPRAQQCLKAALQALGKGKK